MNKAEAAAVLKMIYINHPAQLERDSQLFGLWWESELHNLDYEGAMELAKELVSSSDRWPTIAGYRELRRQLSRPERTRALPGGKWEPTPNGMVWMNHLSRVKGGMALGQPPIKQMHQEGHTWIHGDTWNECHGCRLYAQELAVKLGREVKAWTAH